MNKDLVKKHSSHIGVYFLRVDGNSNLIKTLESLVEMIDSKLFNLFIVYAL